MRVATYFVLNSLKKKRFILNSYLLVCEFGRSSICLSRSRYYHIFRLVGDSSDKYDMSKVEETTSSA